MLIGFFIRVIHRKSKTKIINSFLSRTRTKAMKNVFCQNCSEYSEQKLFQTFCGLNHTRSLDKFSS